MRRSAITKGSLALLRPEQGGRPDAGMHGMRERRETGGRRQRAIRDPSIGVGNQAVSQDAAI